MKFILSSGFQMHCYASIMHERWDGYKLRQKQKQSQFVGGFKSEWARLLKIYSLHGNKGNKV